MTILTSREKLTDDLSDLKLRIAKTNARRNAQINLLRRNIVSGSFRRKLHTKPKDFYRHLYYEDPCLYPLAYPWRSSSLDSLLLDKYYEDDYRKSAVLDHNYDILEKYDRSTESGTDLLSKLKDFVVEQERELTNDLLRKIADRRCARERFLKPNIPSLKSRDQLPLTRDPPFLNPINKKDNFYKRYNAFVKKILRPLRKSSPTKSFENVSNATGTNIPYRPTYSRSYLDYDPLYRPRWYWYSSPLYRRYLSNYDYLPKLQPAIVPRDVESIIQSKCDNRRKIAKDSFFPAPASYKYDPFESDSYLRSSLPSWKQYYYTQKLRSKPSNERYLDYYDPYYDFFPNEASVNSTEELSNEEGADDDAIKLVDEYRDAIYEDIIRNLRNKQYKGKGKKAPNLAFNQRQFGYRINESEGAHIRDNSYTRAEKWENEPKIPEVVDDFPSTQTDFNNLPKNVGLVEKYDSIYNTKYSSIKDYKNFKTKEKERSPNIEYNLKYNEKVGSVPENNYKADRIINSGCIARENVYKSYPEETASKPSFHKYQTQNAFSKKSKDLPLQKFGNELQMQENYKPTFKNENSYITKFQSKPSERDENNLVFQSSPGVIRGVQSVDLPEELYTNRQPAHLHASENENLLPAYPTMKENEEIRPSVAENETTRQQPRPSAFENQNITFQNSLHANLKTNQLGSENLNTYSSKCTAEFPQNMSQTYLESKNEDESFHKYVPDESIAPNRQSRPFMTESENLTHGHSLENSKHAILHKFSTSKSDDSYRPEASPTKFGSSSLRNVPSRYVSENVHNADQPQSSIYENKTFQECPENVSLARGVRCSIPEDKDTIAGKYPPDIPSTDDISFQKYSPIEQSVENRRTSMLYSSPTKEIKSAKQQEDKQPLPKSSSKIHPKVRTSLSEIENKAFFNEISQSPAHRRVSISNLENASRSPTKEIKQRNSLQEDEEAHIYRTENPTKSKLYSSVTLENETKLNDVPPDSFSTSRNNENNSAPSNSFEETTTHSRRSSALQSKSPTMSADPVERVPPSRRSSIVSTLQESLDTSQTVSARRGSIKPYLPRKSSTQMVSSPPTRSPEKTPIPAADSYSIEEVSEPVEPFSYPVSNIDISRTDHHTESIQKQQKSAAVYDENNPYITNSNEIHDPSHSAPGYSSSGYYDQYSHPYENCNDIRNQNSHEAQPKNGFSQQFYDQRYSMPSNGNSANYDAYNYYPSNEGYPDGYDYDRVNYHQPPTNSAYLPQEYTDYTYPQKGESYGDKFEENPDPRDISGYAQEYDDDPSKYHRSSLPRNLNDVSRQEPQERNFVTPYDQYTVDQKEPDRSLNSIDENSNSLSLNESSKRHEQDSTDDVTHEVSIDDSSAADSNPSKSIDPPKTATAKERPALARRSSKNVLSSQSSEEKKSKSQPQINDLQKRSSKTKLTESKFKRMPSSIKNKPVVKKT